MTKKQTSNKKQNGRMVLSRRAMFTTFGAGIAAITFGSGTTTASSDGYGEGEYGAGEYGAPTGTLAVVPVIERFESTDRSNSARNRFNVDWAVSDDGGDLNTVVTTLRYEGSTVDAESTSVTGKDASGSHLMRVKGPVDEIVLSVNDTQNRVTTERKSV